MKSLLNRLFQRPFEKRYDVLNYFARERNLRRYLEIGTSSGRSMKRVRCPYKVGVDPNPRVSPTNWTLHTKTSDDFFEGSEETFDLIFIDGLHLAEQALRDLFNSLAVLNRNGVILLHDCNPPTENAQLRDLDQVTGRAWNGDVWKAIVYVRESLKDLFCCVLKPGQGMGLVIPRNYEQIPRLTPEVASEAQARFNSLSWPDLETNRNDLLGLLEDREEMELALRKLD